MTDFGKRTSVIPRPDRAAHRGEESRCRSHETDHPGSGDGAGRSQGDGVPRAERKARRGRAAAPEDPRGPQRATDSIPTGTARSLATSRTETIGLVFCDETSEFLTNPFYSGVLAGIAAETSAHGYSLAFCSFSLTPAGQRGARCRRSCASGGPMDSCLSATRTTR